MSPNLGLGPLVGFILWHLTQDKITGQQARELAANHPGYQGFTDAQLDDAMYRALNAQAITEAVQQLDERNVIGSANPTPLPGTAVFGVRVGLTHTDAQGRQSVASVVVNASVGTTVEQILDRVQAYANEGELAGRTGHASPGTFAFPAIFQVMPGGYDNAALTIN